MKLLTVQRASAARIATLGILFVESEFECYTLEDPMRDVKIKGETAIPLGEYRVTLYDSPKFGRTVLLLHDVPGFDLIEMHPGNDTDDTDGCVLVGTALVFIQNGTKPWLQNSVAAFLRLFDKVERWIKAGEEVRIRFVMTPA